MKFRNYTLRSERRGQMTRCRETRLGTSWPKATSKTPSAGAGPASLRFLRAKANQLLIKRFGMKTEQHFRFIRKTLNVEPERARVYELNERELKVVVETLEGGWDTRI